MNMIRRTAGVFVVLSATIAAGACGADPEEWSTGGAHGGSGSSSEDIGEVRQAVVGSAGWNTTGNNLTGSGNGILGAKNTSGGPYGLEFQVKPSTTGATRGLLIDAAYPPNLIGGSSGNSVTSGVIEATIGGGGDPTFGFNTVTDNGGVVAGGLGNQAGDAAGTVSDADYAVVSGGALNTAQGVTATVGGGQENDASGEAATISGGYINTASGNFAVVSGGTSNTASGTTSFVAGGSSNVASGQSSFAAGQHASANFDGCFVWADKSTTTTLECGAANKFVVRAAGGTTIYSNSAATTGVTLPNGQGSWDDASDRNAKTDFAPVVPRDVLRRVASMPVSTWSYKSQVGIRHMGPMAQDFRAAFGLGTGERTIATIDAGGVAIAAIKGLNEKTVELETKLAKLGIENEELRQRLDRLEASRAPSVAHASIVPGGSLGFVGIALGAAGVFLARQRRHNGERKRQADA